MFLIIGLGNPGPKYSTTRHNIGFMALNAFQKENNFPKFKLDKKSKTETSKRIIEGKEVILAKPQQFMNSSGLTAKSLTINYKLLTTDFTANLIVVHDDFDLPFGEIKTSHNSGSAGHRGVQSIIDHLKTKNFTRVRVGIRPNYQLPPKQSLRDATGQATTNYQLIKAENFVLKKFNKEEEKQLPQIIKKTCQALNLAITNDIEKALSEFN